MFTQSTLHLQLKATVKTITSSAVAVSTLIYQL